MPALQMWPCHVTQDANFYFFLILHLILGKAAKFLAEKLSTSKVISQKPHGGGVENTPPSAFRLMGNVVCFAPAAMTDQGLQTTKCTLLHCILSSICIRCFVHVNVLSEKPFVS